MHLKKNTARDFSHGFFPEIFPRLWAKPTGLAREMDPATQNHFVELQSRLQISNVTMVNLCSTNHSSLVFFATQKTKGFFTTNNQSRLRIFYGEKDRKTPLSWDPTDPTLKKPELYMKTLCI